MDAQFSIKFTFEGKEYQAFVTFVPDTSTESGYEEYHLVFDDQTLIDRFSNNRIIADYHSFFECTYLPVPDDEVFMNTILEALKNHLSDLDISNSD